MVNFRLSILLKILDNYIKSGQGKKAIRRIFHKISLDDFEKAKLEEIKAVIYKDKVPLPSK